jgi:Protein of unknown function (DUF3106)
MSTMFALSAPIPACLDSVTRFAIALHIGWLVLVATPLAVCAQTATNVSNSTNITSTVSASTPQAKAQTTVKPLASKASESGPSWQSLSSADKSALKPMQDDWQNLDANRKKKWLAVATRYQTMNAADQARMHQRMVEWAKLTPTQRAVARDNYSAVLSSPSSSGDATGKGNLNEQWNKYQALPAEKRALLAAQANKPAQESDKAKP